MERHVFGYRFFLLFFMVGFLAIFGVVFATAGIKSFFDPTRIIVNGHPATPSEAVSASWTFVLSGLATFIIALFTFLFVLNAKIEVDEERVRQYDLFGRLKFEALLSDLKKIEIESPYENYLLKLEAIFVSGKLKISQPRDKQLLLKALLEEHLPSA